MKKIIGLMLVVVLALSISVTVFAAETDFVPSINEKSAPEITKITVTTIDGEFVCQQHEECVIVTPVSEITEEDRLSDATKNLLVEMFNKIKAAAKLSDVFTGYSEVDNMVVRDLFDVSSICDGLDAVFPKDGTTIEITFDLGVSAKTNVMAFAYRNGAWDRVKLTNNGDGTVSSDFTHFCPVAFLVAESETGLSPDTGDASNIALWITLLVVSVAAIITLVVITLRKRNCEK